MEEYQKIMVEEEQAEKEVTRQGYIKKGRAYMSLFIFQFFPIEC